MKELLIIVSVAIFLFWASLTVITKCIMYFNAWDMDHEDIVGEYHDQ